MPIDRGAIDAQLGEIGEGERWWEQREFRDLPHILRAEEKIRGVCNGRFPGPRRPRLPTRPWLVVATNERLICLRQERFGRKQLDIDVDQITGIRQKSRLRTHQITLVTARRKYRLRIPKSDAFRFVGVLSSLVPGEPARELVPRSLSWVPGIGAIAALPGMAGIVSKAALLSPPDYVTREHLEAVTADVERLQEQVERLQQEVHFLEDLLHRRADGAALRQSPSDHGRTASPGGTR